MARRRVAFDPPLLNTSSAFSSTLEQLSALYHSPSTGAVTTRTALLNEGFRERPLEHQHLFFQAPLSDPLTPGDVPSTSARNDVSAMNTYGYSPYPLAFYLSAIELLVPDPATQRKPFIISVAGPPEDVAASIEKISRFGEEKGLHLLAEINLSCPNISGTAPAGYSPASIWAYLAALPETSARVPVGLKVPPYTYAEQMRELIHALEMRPDAISFLTATNTLGNCLYLPPGGAATLPEGLEAYLYGALSGPMIHPLALGNVFSLRNMLNETPSLSDVAIIGAGGVVDHDSFMRMRQAGADAVGVATALGWKGVEGFENILGWSR
ncbi:FMN-linked oxidoreductase [Exidia glandulosa HHB12029]|uniref:FMN-linked oxidoreductase n=1 Tax=Exidia glandulosa HHB12029 TaxID=1314781 RepID=A0A166AFZ8_EXIGL|nr:FMN-linked oxidoreductase [Exidia glandulosa HHB12029]